MVAVVVFAAGCDCLECPLAGVANEGVAVPSCVLFGAVAALGHRCCVGAAVGGRLGREQDVGRIGNTAVGVFGVVSSSIVSIAIVGLLARCAIVAVPAAVVLVVAASAAVPVFYNIVYVATDFAIGACLVVRLDILEVYVAHPTVARSL